MAQSGPSSTTPLLNVDPVDSGKAVKYSDRQPLRSELLSVEQMSRHGRRLASSHKIVRKRGKLLLLPRLSANQAVLLKTHNLITQAVEGKRPIAPASEWLLDNFYLIRKQIRLTRQHLPKDYNRELPRLLEGPSRDYPRVYDIALELIMHGDGRVDTENLTRFVEAYQSISVLDLGELWAIPIMLRLALIENLRRVASGIAADRIDQTRAATWADRMLDVASRNPKALILEMADLVRSDQPMSSAFVAEFTRRLQGRSHALMLPLNMIEQQLVESGLTIKDLVRSESQKQAADLVTISNSIGSLRVLEAIDWREFIESVSTIHKTLLVDPAGVYGRMDFDSRDRYRHVVEKLARFCDRTETEVAGEAVAMANESRISSEANDRLRHVGYFLIGRGRPDLERRLGVRLGASVRVRKFGRRWAAPFYLGAIALVTGLIAAGVVVLGSALGLSPAALVVLGIVMLFCASHFTVGIVNWFATMIVSPDVLPSMDFSRGIPPESRTLVVVPTMLGSPDGVHDLLEGLEIRFLGNRDEKVHFCLLTDFRDADQETVPGDDRLVRLARTGIERLNARYGNGRSDRFFLLHRPRRWNPFEKIWMGYERKRGKLADMNALLRGGSRDPFSAIAGDISILPEIKYVITLDTDTELPRDAARALAGAMAHPLNRPIYDTKTRLVRDGYAILQPRVATGMNSASQSWFLRLFGGDPGIDPYTRSVSDVYQDLFGEGSFIGKGIYDVDAFVHLLEGRFPENRILSHDLLEGCHARAGLVTNVQLFEDFPPRYMVDVSRRHRWIRGDWQIASWLFGRAPSSGDGREPNPLSAVSRWKIFDNLRRSLVPLALSVLLIFGWIFWSEPLVWTLLTAGTIFLIPFLLSWIDLSRRPGNVSLGMHLAWVSRAVGRNMAQALFTLIMLPFEALFSLDAVLRTLVRLLVTRRLLLQWTTSSDALGTSRSDLASHLRSMWTAPLLSALLTGALAWGRPESLTAALPILALWFFSPLIAWWVSVPLIHKTVRLSDRKAAFLRAAARRTWRFFEKFVGPDENWLPPDNFQEQPVEALAHRTSPTNMGLALLANLTAYDLGFIPPGTLIDRTAATFDTMDRLDRFRRHFYNWYDTHTLEPLHPLYVSTVDSGNLAGHLLTLRQGLLELTDAPIVPLGSARGLAVTLDELLRATAAPKRREEDKAEEGIDPAAIDALRPIAERLVEQPGRLSELQGLLIEVDGAVSAFLDDAGAAGLDSEAGWWAQALLRHCAACHSDLELLAPWLEALPRAKKLLDATAGDDARLLVETIGRLDACPTLRQITTVEKWITPLIERIIAQTLAENFGNVAANGDRHLWLSELAESLELAARSASARIDEIEALSRRCWDLADFDYGLVYDKKRRLMAIGYNVSEHRLDGNCYDLLASEARLSSFVAIAQGRLPQDHWFALGRLLTRSGGKTTLISWGGSMFEYLMPLLVMPDYAETLLGRSLRSAVKRQVQYGKQCGIPWGISESGYNAIDAQKNYQYRSFGVPGLGFRRDLADDLVVAPYASALALMVAPASACANLERMAAMGFYGAFGFFEAIDFTPSRRPPNKEFAVVRSFMAHHQGMSLLSMAHTLLDSPMQRRFRNEPIFRATELLLQERIPKVKPFYPHEVEYEGSAPAASPQQALMRIFKDPSPPLPEVHLLSNGHYSVMITNSGAGYSRWNDLAVTRWHEDTTRDHWGTFCFVRDVETGDVWSTGYQPGLGQPENYQAIFLQARAEFRRSDGDFDTYMKVAVSPEDDVELRRVSITNRSRDPRTLELTSYAEVVLAPPSDDAAHTAFSNLFVQTEIVREPPVVLCSRRKRSKAENPAWMFHMMTLHETDVSIPADDGVVSFETDRMRFVGRCRTIARPAAMDAPGALSNSEGSVLDPVVAIRRTVTILPEETAVIDIVTGMSPSRDQALDLAEKYHDRRLAERVFDLAWTHALVVLRQLNATEADAQLFGRLASSIIYSNPAHRAPPAVLMKNRRGQSGLWGYSISGDLPIVLLRISDQSNIPLVRQLVQAHAYWNIKGVPVDLIIWNEEHSGYRQPLQDEIMGLVSSGTDVSLESLRGSIFVKNIEHIGEDDQILMQAVARVIITDGGGSLAEQVGRRLAFEPTPLLVPAERAEESAPPSPETNAPERPLTFYNGLGGFSRSGREYVINSAPGKTTPAPWANVLANPGFGTVVTESGGSYTWSENAHEFRLTPWYNDTVCDSSGEAFYIRDELSGRVWSPSPLPVPGRTPYSCRHGFGYTIFEHTEEGVASRMTHFVSANSPVKYVTIQLQNRSNRPRRLSMTGYFELVLGERRQKNSPHVTTAIDPRTGAILARNSFNTDFRGRVVFVDVNRPDRTFTTDRIEFIGRNGSLADPAALRRTGLSGRTGPAVDPCVALQAIVPLEPGELREVVFVLGCGHNSNEARKLLRRHRGRNAARRAFNTTRLHWKRLLRTVQVETPDQAVNFLANGWLLYQTLGSRIWGRSGFYQSGGAYGFRDQLQDTMAVVHADPALMREHLIRAAGRQFVEGDVQHWWHPPSGRGVRTHFSDDYLWLPLAVCRYVAVTGDSAVLDEMIPFITGRSLGMDEEAYYDLPAQSDVQGTLYDHCVRALRRGLRFGAHGLPLMGCGDWNDGMNLVGARGDGESVWLAFFLVHVMEQFKSLAAERGDKALVDTLTAESDRLRDNIEQNAWDGEWYRRAYFDDGTPLGTAESTECRIDSIPQAWAVLSGAGASERARAAMESVDRMLVDREAGLIQLFDPPFDRSDLEPGYIKGYVPGVRENGGQYTHAAVWTVMAFAALGRNERAWELLSLINPIRHGDTPEKIKTYMVEPYVAAADVYSRPPYRGRGGWTWYTGSCGWMYRMILESLIGLTRQGGELQFRPRLPLEWDRTGIVYRYGTAVFDISYERAGTGEGVDSVTVDGRIQESRTVRLIDDGRTHTVVVRFGAEGADSGNDPVASE